MMHLDTATKKNVYLMQIQNKISEKFFLPLPLGYLWSYCNTIPEIESSYSLEGVFMFRDQVDQYLNQMEVPSVIGISTYVWNWEVSKKFAREVKKKWPEARVVMGGPQVPYELSFFNEFPYVDFIVTYEGELQFSELLLELNKSEPDFNSVEGLMFKGGVKPLKRKAQKVIDDIPSPYLNGFFDKLISENRPEIFNMIIETNRGCPYTCTFCDMQDEFYTKLRQFDLDRMKKELDWASVNRIEYIECADSNFGIFKRDIEIIKHVCELRKKTGSPRSFNFTSAKNQPKHVEEIQTLLIDNGLKRGISVSLQSFNPEVQKAIRRWNEKPEDLTSKLQKYSDKDYESYIELILGLPMESKRTWVDGVGWLLNQDYKGTLLIHPLSVVPNTPFSNPAYKEMYGLKYTTTRSPAQGFCFGTESPEEREVICYGSNTMSLEDWVDSYYFGKTVVGAYYYHRLCYHLVEYLNRQGAVNRGCFFESLLQYTKSSDGFLNEEYNESTALLKETLFNLRPWGRKVFGESDMYWSDQAASAMAGLKRFDEFSADILNFCKSQKSWGLNPDILNEIMNFNHLLLEKPESRQELSGTFQYDWLDYFQSRSVLKLKETKVKVRGKRYSNYRDHALNVYWYGRKSQRALCNEVSYEI
jgi:putative methyltransferase